MAYYIVILAPLVLLGLEMKLLREAPSVMLRSCLEAVVEPIVVVASIVKTELDGNAMVNWIRQRPRGAPFS